MIGRRRAAAAAMSGTDSESESGRGAEEEEEEEPQRSSDGEEAEEEEEEENEAEDEEAEDQEGENGHTSQGDESAVRSSRKRKVSSSAAVANGDGSRPTKAPSSTALAFPISRVRRLVKSEVDDHKVAADAGFLIAKAGELFLEKFVEDAFDKMTEDERTVLSYNHLASHVSRTDRYDFLADFVPEMLSASTAALAAKVQQAEK